MKKSLFVAALIAAASFTHSAHAELLKLTQTSQVPEFKYNLDVVGIKPGMTMDVAKEILIKEFEGIRIEESGARYEYKNVESEPFITGLYGYTKSDGNVILRLTSPVLGSVVSSIERSIDYSDVQNKPSPVDLMVMLSEKYGEPFQYSKSRSQFKLSWHYGDDCKKVAKPDGWSYTTKKCPISLNARIDISSGDELKRLVVNLDDNTISRLDINSIPTFITEYLDKLPKEPVVAPKL
ncbi:hypothetical protein [Brucella thiophenivorans]|nr:hypothetical protein [Brucella thiophenivorans]